MKPILIRKVLGETLREARTESGMTLREVSRSARVSLGYLSEIERGQKEASSELLFSISAALGLTLSVVLADVARRVAVLERPELAAVA